jgi:hypothetical protein
MSFCRLVESIVCGPHLNVCYRGEKGKTTGYYVPKGAQEATREGVAAWQEMQQYLRELA